MWLHLLLQFLNRWRRYLLPHKVWIFNIITKLLKVELEAFDLFFFICKQLLIDRDSFIILLNAMCFGQFICFHLILFSFSFLWFNAFYVLTFLLRLLGGLHIIWCIVGVVQFWLCLWFLDTGASECFGFGGAPVYAIGLGGLALLEIARIDLFTHLCCVLFAHGLLEKFFGFLVVIHCFWEFLVKLVDAVFLFWRQFATRWCLKAWIIDVRMLPLGLAWVLWLRIALVRPLMDGHWCIALFNHFAWDSTWTLSYISFILIVIDVEDLFEQ